jgi:trans-aconitate methyltransferase
VGCGPGQVACLLRDWGVRDYTGIDFSPDRIAQAQTVCPEFNFVVADVFEAKILEKQPYDFVLMTEFLEHVEQDLVLLARVRAGTDLIATVPSFPGSGHVRYFQDSAEVEARYGSLFAKISVTPVVRNEMGKTYYVIEGVRN